MPEVSRFYGIVVKLYFADHNPPHFHAEYGGIEAVVEIGTRRVLAGRLPPRALSLVAEWAALHADELMRQWMLAQSHQPLERIEPLP